MVATDLDRRVLQLCDENAAANGVASLVETRVLGWGDLAALQGLDSGGGSLCTARGWDLVMAADCLYQPEATRPLLKTLSAVCRSPGNGGGGCGCSCLLYTSPSPRD